MKIKIMVLLLAGAVMVGTTSCGQTSDGAENIKSTEPAAQVTDTATEADADTAAVKKAVLESELVRVAGISDDLEDAAVYSAVSISADQLYSLESLDGITGSSLWYVDTDKLNEITLQEKDGAFTVFEASSPAMPEDQWKRVMMTPSETSSLLKSCASKADKTAVVSVPEFSDSRFLLADNGGEISISLLYGREDFCEMKLGETLKLGEGTAKLKAAFSEN